MGQSLTSHWSDFLDEHRWISSFLRRARRHLPPLNFITLHYAYFILVSLVCSAVFYGSSNPDRSISYVDSLFLAVSAMTEAGLNTVNLSQMTTWQQVLLWLLIMLGSTVWVSIWTVLARKHVFERRFDDIVRAERERRARRRARPLALPSLGRIRTWGVGGKRPVTMPAGPTTLPAMGTRMHVRPPGAPAAVIGDDPDKPVPSPLQLRRTMSSPAPDKEDLADPSPFDVPTPLAAPGGGTGSTTSGSADGPSGDHIAFAADPRRKPGGGRIGTGGTVANGQASKSEATSGGTSSSPPGSSDEKQSGLQQPAPPPGHSSLADQDAPTLSHHFLLPLRRNVGRNGQFHGLSSDEREHIGGCEYRALKVLAVMVPCYFVLWQLLGAVALGAWIARNRPDAARVNAVDPFWAGVFNAVSAFNNSGMSLLDANVIPFQDAYFVLIVMGLLILAGNTAFPIFLRLILWTLVQVARWLDGVRDGHHGELREWIATLEFILAYPRRVYTNLFPSRQTWWLSFMLVVLNAVDWAAFELLNLGNPAVTKISPGPRALDGLFQALAVRSGGFYVVPISAMYIGLQVLYVIMMYISVYPVVITMRHSNVYEERSLGIYADETASSSGSLSDLEANDEGALTTGVEQASGGTQLRRRPTTTSAAMVGQRLQRTGTAVGQALMQTLPTFHGVGVRPPPRPAPPFRPAMTATGHTHDDGAANGLPQQNKAAADSRISFINQQVHGQLAHDVWWLVVAVLVIVVIETDHYLTSPTAYSVFNVLFEVVSAYGCVGISVGLPTAAYSFSGGLHAGSKLVLCLVMLRGRHRGLPVALDRAVRLPGDQLHRDEEEDFRIRRSMTIGRRVSLDGS